MNNQKDISSINDVLPQTQCGLCTYKGCKPYATAIVEKNERIDLCLPGGVAVLQKIGELRDVETAPLENEMTKKTKPPMMAVIREDECIGCTICIQACPVDAIIGASKLMHTVLTDICNGCELCVAPCPVDCIDMIVLSDKTELEKTTLADQSRKKFEIRNVRVAAAAKNVDASNLIEKKSLLERKAEIQAILQRTRKNVFES